MLTIGIDEAGYGPLLGPLAVGGVAVRTTGVCREEELARLLDDALTEVSAAVEEAPVVGDSKRVLAARGGRRRLETSVLSFAMLSGQVERLGDLCRVRHLAAPAPWHLTTERPLTPQEDRRLPSTAETLGRALRSRGVESVQLAALLLHECAYNAELHGDRTKGDLLFDAHASVLDTLLSGRRPAEAVHAVLDRHGGRKRYLPHVIRRWPQAFAWKLGEDGARSDYRLGLPEGTVDLSFRVKADADAPWVGLASMVAKFLREYAMDTFNDHFRALCPQVRPTAGYVQDGRRWLEETRPARRAAGIDDERLVRRR